MIRLKQLRIRSFGLLRDKVYDLSDGLNIFEGNNEAGKSSLAHFIRFMFYGLSGRASDGVLSDRARFVNWETGEAGGSLLLEKDGRTYRIERSLTVTQRVGASGNERENVREACQIYDESTGLQVLRNEIPGLAFFGLPEDVFANTVFVGQLSGTGVQGESVSQALENLLVAGDENVNTKRALKTLDEARRTLLHKNGKGGELYERQMELVRSRQVLDETMRIAAETLSDEGSLTELRKRKAEAETGVEGLNRQLDAYRVFEKSRRFLRLEEERERLASLEEACQAFDGVPETEESLSEIRQLRSGIPELEKRKERQANSLAVTDRLLAEDHKEKLKEAQARREDASRDESIAYRSLRQHRMMGIILSALGLCALAACAVLAILWKRFLPWPLTALVAGLLLAAGGVWMLLAAKRNLQEQADAEERMREPDPVRQPSPEREAQAAALKETADLLAAAGKHAERLLASFGISDYATTENGLETAEAQAADVCARRQEAKQAADRQSSLVDYLANELRGLGADEVAEKSAELLETEEGRRVYEMSDRDLEDVRRRLDYDKQRIRLMAEKERELEERLLRARAGTVSPAEARERTEELERQTALLRDRYDAYMLAYNTLETASENVRSGILPRIVREAENALSRFSGGRYGRLAMDGDFHLTYTVDGTTRPLETLSAGTRNIANLALRLALIRVLSSGTWSTAVLDESLSMVDEQRLQEVLRFLQEETNGQTILLTCRAAEADVGRRMGASVTVM